MAHFGSPTPVVIDEPAVEHEPKVTIESGEDSALYPRQFIDGEPPFKQSFMVSMSVQLGFNDPEQQNESLDLLDSFAYVIRVMDEAFDWVT
ncbi:hypothetical protein CYMTET_7976 [Cymbomonas tetramitiformis]|uniref:Uncharacterized protein n=1 Tax=Cymbomonas tetramitiformis TaxID=36881 RepID=A0AAE0GVW0_9CHLO|nr:hypothetical protein CYMTET_7976 [Cymbomonas tetramitiformis]